MKHINSNRLNPYQPDDFDSDVRREKMRRAVKVIRKLTRRDQLALRLTHPWGMHDDCNNILDNLQNLIARLRGPVDA